MSRICIVSANNLYLVPYIKNYVKNISSENYDLILWDRDHIVNEVSQKTYIFRCKKSMNKLSKYISFFKFSRFTKKIIKKNKYDRIIFLHSIVPIIIHRYIIKQYKNNYVYDVRDYTYEDNAIYRIIQNMLIKNSGLNIISSKGYLQFLPNSQYVVVHNYSGIDEKLRIKRIRECKRKKTLNISFIGFVRFHEIAKKILYIFNNDSRFHLNFIGKGANGLDSYVLENKINNVTIIDYFDPENTLQFYDNSDIVYNLYGFREISLKLALSNKLYYAASLYKPILVFEDTFMHDVADKYGIAIPVNFNWKDIPNRVYNWYQKMEVEKFYNGCDQFLKDVLTDNERFDYKLKKFLKK